MATFEWSGFDRLIAHLGAVADPDLNPLMAELKVILVEDNREGSLHGIDRYDVPYAPVTYRPLKRTAAVKATKPQRNNAPADRRGIFAGMGEHPAGTNNNLTSYEYRRLGGPPLAPRGPNSRIITNLATSADDKAVNGVWTVFGFWREVMSTTGYAFLHDLFEGHGRYGMIPARDPRGVRKAGRTKALAATKRFLIALFGGNA